jgi:FtsH-binding integral membrane protein
MAIDAPKGLSCQWYAVARGGWRCARWGDFSSQPYLTLAVLLVSFLCAFWFSRYGDQTQTPFMLYFVGQVGFVVCFAGAIRLVYFVQGKVNPEHAKVSAIAIGCAAASMLALGLYMFYLKRKQANRLRS